MIQKELKVVNNYDPNKVAEEVNKLLDSNEGWQVFAFGPENVGAAGF